MSEETKINAAEEKARNDGWVPLEEWTESGKNESDWVDYKEFNFRGELMGRIQNQSRKLGEYDGKIEQLTKVIRELGEHNKKMADIQYKKAIDDLKNQKVKALEENDSEQVVKIDEHMDELKEAAKQASSDTEVKVDVAPNTSTQVPPEVMTWLSNPSNNWYAEDPIMRGAANQLYYEMELQGNLTPEQILAKVESQIKSRFPDKFGGSRRSTPMTTETSTEGVKSTKKYTVKDLTPEQKEIGETFVKAGAFDNIQKYVDDLVSIGEIGG